jgi:hypothetical protein
VKALPLLAAPAHCQYSAGPCDQDLDHLSQHRGFVAYPSDPEGIAETVEQAAAVLRSRGVDLHSWKIIPNVGKILFCEICKTIRGADVVIADVTTLSFNVLFELGYAIGLNKPVLPLRDSTYIRDRQAFEELGLLDTLGYQDFVNSSELAEKLQHAMETAQPLAINETPLSTDTPLYVLKGPLNTDGALQLMRQITKTGLRYRAFDQDETPRLSLGEARRQVSMSIGVVAHLLSPNRTVAQVHNAMCALVCGMAMAQGKTVVMVQEEIVSQPLDYRDVVLAYKNSNQIPRLLEQPLSTVIASLQDATNTAERPGRRLLQLVDMGDVAAENEIHSLGSYFVETGQFVQAQQGHARLVTGRKGSGKTAIFYEVRRAAGGRRTRVVLDLRPEGHQFTRLRELLAERFSEGLQEHTVTAFWTYLLLGELAREILDQDRAYVQYEPTRLARFERLATVYERHDPGWDADFPQRLKRQVDRVTSALERTEPSDVSDEITALMFLGDHHEMTSSVIEYLTAEKDSVFILVDNLDKGWPVRGTHEVDILIVRGLLESTRKLQHQLRDAQVDFKTLVFLRNDIYEQLNASTPDKGKDTVIRLDWEDPQTFRELVRLRLAASTKNEDASFDDLWRRFFATHVGTQDSFDYMLERTLRRPRDLLQFIHRCIDTALNRGHDLVSPDDIRAAESIYSEELLVSIVYEIQATYPEVGEVLYGFQALSAELDLDEVRIVALEAGVAESTISEVVDLLLWYGFLGVSASMFSGERYSYEVQYNLRRLLTPVERGQARLVIHPGFRAALDTWMPGTSDARE